jgi:hypothetical protein
MLAEMILHTPGAINDAIVENLKLEHEAWIALYLVG